MTLSFFYSEIFFLISLCFILVLVSGRDIFFKLEVGLVFSRMMFVTLILMLLVYLFLLLSSDVFNLNVIFQNDLFFMSRVTVFYKIVLTVLLLLYFIYIYGLNKPLSKTDIFVYFFMLLTFFFLSHVVEVNNCG